MIIGFRNLPGAARAGLRNGLGTRAQWADGLIYFGVALLVAGIVLAIDAFLV